PRMSAAELKYISEGGAVVDMDHKKEAAPAAGPKMRKRKNRLAGRFFRLRQLIYAVTPYQVKITIHQCIFPIQSIKQP
ncbi:hypothetical protein ACIOVJ_28820, partial [Klebsiella pneumoniae]